MQLNFSVLSDSYLAVAGAHYSPVGVFESALVVLVAPITGGLAGGFIYKGLLEKKPDFGLSNLSSIILVKLRRL